eukprot:gene22632-biopygen17752
MEEVEHSAPRQECPTACGSSPGADAASCEALRRRAEAAEAACYVHFPLWGNMGIPQHFGDSGHKENDEIWELWGNMGFLSLARRRECTIHRVPHVGGGIPFVAPATKKFELWSGET